MKKFFAAVALAAMCFTFTGCSQSPSPVISPERAETGNPSNPSESEAPKQPPITEQPEREEITEMFVTVNGNKLAITLAENSSVDALVEILKRGDVTYTADDYGDFEKVGDIGYTLPRNDMQITTQAGDVILYQGRNICLYYGTNGWSFTRIGKINGYSSSELRSLLGAGGGEVAVTLSLK